MKTDKKTKTRGTREGKHRLGKVSVGMYVDEDFRALMVLLADKTGETVTELMMDGVRKRARAEGLLTANDEIVGKYKVAIKVIKAAFAARKETKK